MPQAARGFTLVELLVAIAVMAVLSLMSWRAIDGWLYRPAGEGIEDSAVMEAPR